MRNTKRTKRRRQNPVVGKFVCAMFRRDPNSAAQLIPFEYEYPDTPAPPKQIRCESSLGIRLNHYFVDKAD